MDPLSLASGFATIISLIGMFRSERRAGEAESYEDFISWLKTHQHDQVVELLSDNAQLASSTQSLLAEQHEEVMECLSALNQVLSDIASRVSLTQPLTAALGIESSLSDQAISILRQMNEKNASRFQYIKARSRETCFAVDGQKGELSLPEKRFIEDDINTLCAYCLLGSDCNSQGVILYSITRTGARLGEQ